MRASTHLSILIIALWASVLFLPFKGLKASLILFVSVLIAGLLLKPLREGLKGLKWKIKLPPIPVKFLIPFIIAGALVIPLIFSDYVIDVAILAGIYIILALGLNVVVGFAGLLNLGFAAFYAIGAYSFALIGVKWGIGFWSALPLSLALTTASGFIMGAPGLRLRGDYLAIVTLGFGEITRLVLNNWDSFTNGPNGIAGIQRPYLMDIPLTGLAGYYYVVLISVLFSVFIIKRVHSSRIGRAWIAIREDEIAAGSMGINTTAYKLYAFAFGAFWAGLAGALFSAKMQFISPESFTFMESVFILCMVILGGMGSIPGVMLGAVILVVLPELLREIQIYRMLALGGGLVLLMLFRPQGILGGKGVST
ncbi:MAG: branched-chain amino acid ABC transporter permease [Nitrospirae bacterium]|nr:branched-chain amino acid ABC transporter permease [Nitrospirota bacterium]